MILLIRTGVDLSIPKDQVKQPGFNNLDWAILQFTGNRFQALYDNDFNGFTDAKPLKPILMRYESLSAICCQSLAMSTSRFLGTINHRRTFSEWGIRNS